MNSCLFADFAVLSTNRFAQVPSVRVFEHRAFSYWEFCCTEIDAKGEINAPKPKEPIRFLAGGELSPKAVARLAALQPGAPRAAVLKTWSETGGMLQCQFLLLEPGGGPEFVAVRIEWRPASMPERIFANRKLRERWIRHHAPLPAPDDVAMHISRPYRARWVID